VKELQVSRYLGIAMVQAPALAEGIEAFGAQLRGLVALNPGKLLWVFPELHLSSHVGAEDPVENARSLDDPAFDEFGVLSRELGIWLVPGSIYERDAEGVVHNTALVYSPEGERVATYRKMFPWRPAERSVPGGTFSLFDIPGYGRVGLSICYDIWFPEHTRHLAWYGADLVLNVVQTGTNDREQETAIVRGNAIMNQVWIASVNSAAPTGRGRSMLVDPDGVVRTSSGGAHAEVLTAIVDMGLTQAVRDFGTASVSRPWCQMRPEDAVIDLPLYGGRIDPATWTPGSGGDVAVSAAALRAPAAIDAGIAYEALPLDPRAAKYGIAPAALPVVEPPLVTSALDLSGLSTATSAIDIV